MSNKFLLTDNVILNGGDAAILEGTLLSLKDDLGINIEDIKIHCDYFDSAINHYPDLPLGRSIQESINKYSPRFFWRFDYKKRFSFPFGITLSQQERSSLNDYKDADIIITCGGSFLTDAYQLDLTLFGYDVALNLRKPIYLLGQSIGPFVSSEKREQVASRLRRFEKIIVRDHKSYLEALDMGCSPERVYEARDAAFMLSPEKKCMKTDNDVLTIGISVRKWTYPHGTSAEKEQKFAKYINSMAKLISQLIEVNNAQIIMVSTCQGDQSYSFEDNIVATTIYNKLDDKDKSHVSVISDFQSPTKFLNNLNCIDVFIGTRMHACILSLLMNIPTINICYEFKSKELFNKLELADYVFDIENIEPNKILASIKEILINYQRTVALIENGTSNFKDLNSKVFSNMLK